LLGSHGAAVALQATLGASVSLAMAYLSYELVEKRFLRLKRLFETTKGPAPHPSWPAEASLLERLTIVQGGGLVTTPVLIKDSSDTHSDLPGGQRGVN